MTGKHMYGMLYRLQPKKGQERAVLDALFRWEQEILPTVTGFVGGYIFEPPSASEIVGIFIFAAQDDCVRTHDDPNHAHWDQQLLALIEAGPSYSEGEFTELMKELRGL